MEHGQGEFKGARGFRIFYQWWRPEEPKAVLLVVHGYAEHSGRYKNLVNYFVPRGYAVYALDHRGHGRSQGRRGYVERFRYYLDDLKAFYNLVREREPGRKIFMVGHSMGGLIALAYALQHQEEMDGLILSGAGVRVGGGVSPLTVALGKLLSAIAPRVGMVKIEAEAISRDPAVVKAYVNDPLVYTGKVSARLGAEMLAIAQEVERRAGELRLPCLIMHGGADRLADPDGSRALYERISSEDKALKIYEGFYHEIFNEPERERVFRDMEAWLEARA